MAERTETDIVGAVERSRQEQAALRSTPEGESEYQATLARVLPEARRFRDEPGNKT